MDDLLPIPYNALRNETPQEVRQKQLPRARSVIAVERPTTHFTSNDPAYNRWKK